MRDPRTDEINTPEFNAVWDIIKHWDIGLPEDIADNGGQLYSHGTGSHVVRILDALRDAGCLTAPILETLSCGCTVSKGNRCPMHGQP